MGARLYDPVARSFLSPDPLAGPAGAAWGGARYGFAGNDPVGAADPAGLSPVTAAQLRAYNDQHRGGLASAWNGVKSWWGRNWQYVAAGAAIAAGVAVMATGVGGPIGAAMIGGALMGAGGSTWSQKQSTGTVDWRRVAVAGVGGAVTGLIGGGAASVAARAAKEVTSCLGRNMVTGAASRQAIMGAETRAGSGVIARFTGVAKSACFVEGTPVVMADRTTKPIEQVSAGEQVQSWNPDTGDYEPREVVATYSRRHVATWRITTTDGGATTSTAGHPFHVTGRGWTPVKNLRPGDSLHGQDDRTVTVCAVEATGDSATVYNLHIQGIHTYQVTTTTGTPVTVHNECTAVLKPADVRFSQRSVTHVAKIEKSMSENGWKGEPIDVVNMPDRGLTSIDNNRLLAAKRTGTDIEARVHEFDEEVPADVAVRFPGERDSLPGSWGEGARNRIANQGNVFRTRYPNGSWITGWTGQ